MNFDHDDSPALGLVCIALAWLPVILVGALVAWVLQ